MLEIYVSGVFLGHFIVSTLNSPPISYQGFGPFAENGFRAFQRAKMSCEDTQHKLNTLDFSSKNQIE